MGLKLLFFSGKGGAGKTTLSSLFALLLAEKFKVLLVSADPAHSTRDFFLVPYRLDFHKFSSGLTIHEIEPEAVLTQFVEEVERKLKATYSSIIVEELRPFLEFARHDPANFDYALFNEVFNLITSKALDYEYLLLDMAATAQTVKFFLLPERLRRWYELLSRWRKEYLKVKSMIKGEEDDDLLKLLQRKKKIAEEVEMIVKERSTLFWILEPFRFSLHETERALKVLKGRVSKIVLLINKVLKEREFNARITSQIREKFSHYFRVEIPFFREEITCNSPNLEELFSLLRPLLRMI